MRRNLFDTVRAHAVNAAHQGLGVSACPYRARNYQTVWVRAFAKASQADWVG